MVWSAIGAMGVQMLRCGAIALLQTVGCAVRTGSFPVHTVHPRVRDQAFTNCFAAWR